MSDLKIDFKHLNELAKKIKGFHKLVDEDLALLEDENKDPFLLYMAYLRIRTLRALYDYYSETTIPLIAGGFNIVHPFINTDEAKNHGWIQKNINHSTFFVQDEDNENDTEKEKIKQILEAILWCDR